MGSLLQHVGSLVAVRRPSSHGTRASEPECPVVAGPRLRCPVACGNLSFLTRNWACVLCIARCILHHWTTRKVPVNQLLFSLILPADFLSSISLISVLIFIYSSLLIWSQFTLLFLVSEGGSFRYWFWSFFLSNLCGSVLWVSLQALLLLHPTHFDKLPFLSTFTLEDFCGYIFQFTDSSFSYVQSTDEPFRDYLNFYDNVSEFSHSCWFFPRVSIVLFILSVCSVVHLFH